MFFEIIYKNGKNNYKNWNLKSQNKNFINKKNLFQSKTVDIDKIVVPNKVFLNVLFRAYNLIIKRITRSAIIVEINTKNAKLVKTKNFYQFYIFGINFNNDCASGYSSNKVSFDKKGFNFFYCLRRYLKKLDLYVYFPKKRMHIEKALIKLNLYLFW